DPVLNDHLGDIYWRVGRRLEARYQWAQVRALHPEPDLLAQVEKKLKEGLPTEDGKKIADAAGTARVLNDGADQPADDAGSSAGKTPAAPETYTVKPGQTLWSIAAEKLGDG